MNGCEKDLPQRIELFVGSEKQCTQFPGAKVGMTPGRASGVEPIQIGCRDPSGSAELIVLLRSRNWRQDVERCTVRADFTQDIDVFLNRLPRVIGESDDVRE